MALLPSTEAVATTDTTTKPKANSAKLGAEKLTPNDSDLVLIGDVAKCDFHLGFHVVPTMAGVVLHIDETSGVVADDLPSLRAIGFHYLRICRRAERSTP